MRLHVKYLRIARRMMLGVLSFTVLTSPFVLPSGAAQSGRRVVKPANRPPQEAAVASETMSPAAQAETAAAAADTPASRQPAVKFKLVVAGRIETKNSTERAATIFNKFVQRLTESPTVTVTSLGLLKREEAVKRAQSDAESYLVWLQLDSDAFQEGHILLNSPDLEVKYQIYAPGALKVKTKGKVYYQAMGGPQARRDRWPSGTPIKITPEAAGIEAAEMVLDWFKLVEGLSQPEQKK